MQRRGGTTTSRTRRGRPTARRGKGVKTRKSGTSDLVIGGLVCVIGIVITVASYTSASNDPHGGTYIVAWGAILFGGIQFCRGIYLSMG
jgi:hypothetical protein